MKRRAAAVLVIVAPWVLSCSDRSTAGRDTGTPSRDLRGASDITAKPDKLVQAPGWGASFVADKPQDIALDQAGNSYVAGWFNGTASFGSTTLTCKGSTDLFVAKLSSAGKWLWAVSAGGTGQDGATGIAVDDKGDCHVTGYFEGSAGIGATTLTAKGSQLSTFVARIDSAGKWTWAVSASSATDEVFTYSISADSSSSSYVTGYFGGTASFGATTLTAQGQHPNLFVARLDSAGKWQWAVGNALEGYAVGIAVDSAGNGHVGGMFKGTATLGATTLTSKGSYDAFVARLDSAGKWQWAASGGGAQLEEISSICLDGAKNSLVTGRFDGAATFGATTLAAKVPASGFVARLDSSGKWSWAIPAPVAESGNSGVIAVDAAGDSYVASSFKGTATIGATKLSSKGSADAFVAKLTAGGKWSWAESAGGDKFDAAISVATNGAGRVHVLGQYVGTAVVGGTTLPAKIANSHFVWKVR